MRALYIILSFVGGLVFANLAAPWVYNNETAINILITVYTVFAGFLVAIIALVGDPALIPKGSWRIAEHNRENLNNRLIRYSYLFWLYLITIAIIFVGVLFKDAPESFIGADGKQWIARTYLFFGISAFLLSLGLPKALKDSQEARIDQEIENRRKNESIGGE